MFMKRYAYSCHLQSLWMDKVSKKSFALFTFSPVILLLIDKLSVNFHKAFKEAETPDTEGK